MQKHYLLFFTLLCACSAKPPVYKTLDLSSFTRDSCRLSYDTSLSGKWGTPPVSGYSILFKNEWDSYVFAIRNGAYLSLDFYRTEKSTAITGKSVLVPQSKSADSLIFINLGNMHYAAFRTNPDYKVVNLFYYLQIWMVVFANGYTMAI